MIFFIFQIIFEITKACSESQGICLTDIGTDLLTFDVVNPFGFRYGFWTKYLSMAHTYDTNPALFNGSQYGYTLFRQVDPETNETVLLLYQNRIYGDKSFWKYQKLVSLHNNIFNVLKYLSFEASTLEGMWIYYSIAYVSENMIQFIYYSNTLFSLENIYINFQIKSQIQINLGGHFQFNYEGSPFYLVDYLGQISILDFQEPTTIFSTKQDFLSYLDQLRQPSSICEMKVYETNKIENFQYQSGLIFMESWVQLQSQSVKIYIQYKQLNISVSVFGIEFPIKQGKYYTFQKLLDIYYQVLQAWRFDMLQLTVFLMLEKTYFDYIQNTNLYQDNVLTENTVKQINQNFKEWHFVQVYYGFKNDKPVQGMRIWLLDGSVYETILEKQIYRFEDRKLIIRAGHLFDTSFTGAYLNTGLSKIYVCLSDFVFQKKCHQSCMDCDGPSNLNCLSCSNDRYLDNRQCKCNLGSLESNDGLCKTFNNLYPNSLFQFIEASFTLFQFGYFPVKYEGRQFFIKCPKYQQKQNKIFCVECLSNPEVFSENPICKTDYIINDYGQYELQVRQAKDFEFYILDYELQQIRLCVGCFKVSESQIDDTYQYSVAEGKYIQCLDGYYQQNEKCLPCSSECLKCLNLEICTECDGIQVLNQGQCLPCLPNCEQCQFTDTVICIKCSERYSLYQGNCMACGQYCQTCEYMLDKDTNQYYNRCIVCLDSSKYYLQLNAIHCGVNKIQHCQYVIEFHHNEKVRHRDNTIFHLYPKRDYAQSDIVTYCAYCSMLGCTSLLSGECYVHPDQYILDPSGYKCLEQYEYNFNGIIKYECRVFSIENQNEANYQFKLFNYCFGLLEYCSDCYNSFCTNCFPGSYVGLSDGVCYQCPKTCYTCRQQSKYHKNGWKIIYRYIYSFFQDGMFYHAVFGDESADQLEVVCTACNPGYELYKEQCIPSCPVNCKTCKKVGMQNYCIECRSDGKVLSLYQGTCIECPRYCQLCYPKSNELISSANPYYSFNEQFLSTTHTCLLLEAGLNKNEYIYNKDLKQFLKYNNQQVDPNLAQIKFNLYCDVNQFYEDLQQQSNKESFLSQNVRIDEILSQTQQTNFYRFENNNLYEYLGTQQIQLVEFYFALLQDCTISQTSYLFTTLTKNVYAINQASIHLNGNFHSLFLEQSLEILGYEKIQLSNININIAKNATHMSFQSLKTLDVIMNNVNVTSQTNIFSFQFYKIKDLTIQQFCFIDYNFKEVDSIFKVIDAQYLAINLTNFYIMRSTFDNTNLLSFNEQSSQISIVQQNFNIKESVFTKSAIIASKFAYNLTILGLTISESQLLDCSPLFMTDLAQVFTLNESIIQGAILQNSGLFQLNQNIKVDQFNFSDCILENSSSLTQNSNFQFNITLSRFIISNITYDLQSKLLYASTTDGSSEISMINWSLSSVILNNNSTINTDSAYYLIYIQASAISIKSIYLSRQSGITEFYLGLAANITISDMQIENGNIIKSLITNQQCGTDFTFSRYRTILLIEKSEYIYLDDIVINNIIVFDMPIILINSIESQFIKRSEVIKISRMMVRNCIIQKRQATNQFSIFQVISEQKISINFINSTFNYNFYHSQEAESETNSALTMYLFIENGNLNIDNSTFKGNYISQSKNSLMAVFASNTAILNSNFIDNNHFSEQFIKHINWGYKPNKLTLNYLTNYFPVQSLSGNGKLQSHNITLANIKIIGGRANQGGCFYVALNNDGILTSKNSYYQNISTTTKGGCFYIVDKATSIIINLENSVFDSIFTVQEGGVVYFTPLSQIVKFNIGNLTIVDVFSLTGAFLNIHFFNSQSQVLQVTECNIISTVEGLANFISILGNLNEIQKSQLIASTAIFVIQQGELILKNVVSNLFIVALLEATFSSKVSLTSVIIENSYYSTKSAIQLSCNQDETCKVIINKLQVSKYQFYNMTSKQNISTIPHEQLFLQSSCQNDLYVRVTEFENTIIDISQFGLREISQLVLLSNIKSNDKISLKGSSLSQNICQMCQSGLIQLYFAEQISKNANFQLKNIEVFGNDCGQNGCLNFLIQSTKTRLLSQTENQITINQMICSSNKAINGACIYSQGVGLLISQSVISLNNATNLGGGVYYSGDVMNLLLYDNLISNNNAGSGSALYIDENSSPELNKTNNFISSITQLIQSSPTSLSVILNNYTYYNYHTDMNKGFLTKTQDSTDYVALTLPSGQQINQYQYFNITSQEYIPLNLTFRIVPLNDYLERQTNLTSTNCKIQSGYMDQNMIITNNYTNLDSKEFDSKSQDYNFDDLIIYYGANNPKGPLILLFYCNSVKIPVYESVFPYQIINYISDYQLQVNIETLDCQLGEYKDAVDDSCHLCDVQKKQYSVKYAAKSCNFMDEETTLQITPAQLKLKNGYWRLDIYNDIIEKCKNKMDNCLGGWKQGDETCLSGQLGARCESCDSYNIRGQGQYSQKSLYTCGLCEDLGKQILYIIATSVWTIISINLTTKGIETMIMEIQKNRVGKIQLIINANKQTGPYIKMFTNYLQNIAIILNFNVDIPNGVKLYFNILGNPQQQLLISTDCFMVSQFSDNIMYVKIIQTLINPIVYGLIYLLIYFILVTLNKIQYNKIVITTSILYLFFYFQPQAMQLLIASISFQTISGIQFIQANLAYQFYTAQHEAWLPYLIVLIILLGFLFPASLLVSLIRQRKDFFINQLRKNWGYLILEYQRSAYYWEFARILTREFIIMAITFYQDNITLKCFIVFFVIIIYQQGTSAIQPFKTTALNQLDIKSSQVCLISILAILSLTQSMKQYNLVIIFVIFPNALLFLSFLTQLFYSYLQEYEELLDKISDILRSKIPQIERSGLLQNKSERRKIVMERFKLVKKYLFQQVRKPKVYQSFKFIMEPESEKVRYLFTESDLKSGSKVKLFT